MPITKTGMAATDTLAMVRVSSRAREPGLAMKMPKAIEIGRAMTIAARARISVLTVRGMTISLTGRKLAAEIPQSPFTKSESHDVYWSSMGLSRPCALLKAASWSGVASRPRTRRATLMPRRCVEAKTMTEMSHSVMSAGRNRERTNNHSTAAAPPLPGGTAAVLSVWGASPVSEKYGSGTSVTRRSRSTACRAWRTSRERPWWSSGRSRGG